MSRRRGKQGKCVALFGLVALVSLGSTFHNVDQKDPWRELLKNPRQNPIPQSVDSLSAPPRLSAPHSSQSVPVHNVIASSIRPRSDPVVPFRTTSHTSPRYHRSPFVNAEGYQPTGGELPFDPADSLFSPRMWRFVDNTTCRQDDDGYQPEPWQFRAPYAIVLGAMKAGTHAVIESLWDHPSVVRTGHWELHFFDSPRALRNDQGINRTLNLQHYARAVRTAVGPNVTVESSFVEHHQVMIESTPKYLLNSDRIPDFMLCVVPWVKLIAILRDPVARAESHFRYLDENRRATNESMVDWQVWIEDDLRLLAGVLNATSPEEEYYEWKRYQRTPHSQQIIGRGLYVISLEHYLAAMDRINKPRTDLWVIQSERFLKARQEEYDKLLQFLKLSPHRLDNASAEIHATSHGALPMPESIRHKLKQLYQPYNARLYRLLGWDHVWD